MKLIPLASGSKEPLRGESWKRLVSDDPAEHQKWIAEGLNVGCPLAENGLSVVDFDTGVNPAREFFSQHKELCRVIVLTRRGVHFFFSGHTKTRKFDQGDIKGDGGYVVFPPSVVNDHQYRFVEGYEWKEPAPFPDNLFPVESVREVTRKQVHDVMAYLAKIESIQGKDGSAGLVRAAAVCRDAGLSESETTVKLLWWNTLPVVQPPWPADEIARAVHRTYERVKS